MLQITKKIILINRVAQRDIPLTETCITHTTFIKYRMLQITDSTSGNTQDIYPMNTLYILYHYSLFSILGVTYLENEESPRTFTLHF